MYEVNDRESPKPLCENFVIENWKQNEISDNKKKHSVLFDKSKKLFEKLK